MFELIHKYISLFLGNIILIIALIGLINKNSIIYEWLVKNSVYYESNYDWIGLSKRKTKKYITQDEIEKAYETRKKQLLLIGISFFILWNIMLIFIF